jgi:hypothetical protein
MIDTGHMEEIFKTKELPKFSHFIHFKLLYFFHFLQFFPLARGFLHYYEDPIQGEEISSLR